MSRSILLLTLTASLGACQTTPDRVVLDQPDRGVSSVNVPVVTRSDYAFDLAAPDGMLAPAETARLDAWFRSLELGYGDAIYVEGPYAYGARDEVARIAGNYGLLVGNGAPVSQGVVQPGMVRVLVSRTRASVPNCPNWSKRSTPNFDDASMSNYGCAINGNMAAMIANPQDLIHGRDGSGVGDSFTSSRAVDQYRKATPTGSQGLKDISTKGN